MVVKDKENAEKISKKDDSRKVLQTKPSPHTQPSNRNNEDQQYEQPTRTEHDQSKVS